MSLRIRHATSPARPGPSRDRPPAPAPPPPPRWRVWLLPIGLALTFLLLFAPSRSSTPTHAYDYTKFLSQVDAGKVSTASINPSGAITGALKKGGNYTSQIPVAINDTSLAPTLKAHGVSVTGVGSSSSILDDLLSFLPLLLLVGIFVWMGRSTRRQLSGGIMGIGGSKAKVYDESRPSTRFSDVAGYEGAKREVAEVVDFLKHPERYSRAGAVGPRGVLMVGPPGTGKTLLARAVAGEAEVPFLALTGSSFVELFVGVGASRVRDLFADARKRAPSIIFIDEIDAIGQRRGGSIVSNDEREQTLNQLLAEMDGFEPGTGVVVIAATNRPEVLDPALLRPGRFDREWRSRSPTSPSGPPSWRCTQRANIWARTSTSSPWPGPRPGSPGRSRQPHQRSRHRRGAPRPPGHLRPGHRRSTRPDHPRPARRVQRAPPRREACRGRARAGHALVALLSEHADPVAKVTILPSGRALGVTEQLPVDERHLYAESYLHDSLAIRLGGRAAEVLVLGEGSTGAANDLAGATDLALRMVREWGLSARLGPIGYGTESPQYLGGSPVGPGRPYAEATQRAIDEEVSRLLLEAEERARTLLTENRAALDGVVDVLLEKETITGQELADAVRAARDRTPAVAPRPA